MRGTFRKRSLVSFSRRLLGFALLPALSLAAPLLLLPLVSHRFGPAGWSAVGVGQGVGALTSVAIGLSWPVAGGHEVSVAPDLRARRHIFGLSMATRSLVALILIPIACVIVSFIVPDYGTAAALFAAGVALNGLTASWYYAGTGDPKSLVITEGMPRLLGYLAATVGLLGGFDLRWYGVMTLLSGLASVCLNWLRIVGFSSIGLDVKILPAMIKSSKGTAARLLQALYYFGAPTIALGTGFPAGALVVASDQVQKAAGNALAVVPQSFIAWEGIAAGGSKRQASHRQALILLSAAILFGGWLVVAPFALAFLFADRLAFAFEQIVLLGLVIVTYYAARSIELLVLIPNGMTAIVWRVTLVSALAGLGLLGLALLTKSFVIFLAASFLTQALTVVIYLFISRLHR